MEEIKHEASSIEHSKSSEEKEENPVYIIGKVYSTPHEQSTNDYFNFWTDDEIVLNQFDVIKVKHVNGSYTYGIIHSIRNITDTNDVVASYVSSDFGNAEYIPNSNIVSFNSVTAKVLKNDKEIYTPLKSGAQVELAKRKEIEFALGFNDIDEHDKICCGYIEMYKNTEINKITKTEIVPAYLDAKYLIGPEAAHLNISGISGLAAKTSYAMFLLKSIYSQFSHNTTLPQNKEKSEDNPKKENGSIAYVVFNVKGKDLLAIDKPNEELGTKEIDLTKEIYDKLKLNFEPFPNEMIKYYLPYSEDNSSSKNRNNCNNNIKYAFTYENYRERIRLLFPYVEETSPTDSILGQIEDGEEGIYKDVNSWDSLIEKTKNFTKKNDKNDTGIAPVSFKKFYRIINEIFSRDPLFQSKIDNDNTVTIRNEIKNIKQNQIYVIDIAKLKPGQQTFVFLDVLNTIFDKQENRIEGDDSPSKIVVFIDELNKYASFDINQNTPIMENILDVAERGRSLGVSLFGAEQFRSAINQRVTGNCGTHAYGRSNATETTQRDYKNMPDTYKSMLDRLEPGEYIISHSRFPSLLKVKFPRPFYKQFKS